MWRADEHPHHRGRSAGASCSKGRPQEYHYNPLGVIHGGMAATLLDSALGCCVNSCLDAGDFYTTLELKVNYLRPMTIETGPVRAIATIVHVGQHDGAGRRARRRRQRQDLRLRVVDVSGQTRATGIVSVGSARSISARCGSRNGGSTSASPRCAGSSSTANPGPSVASSNSTPPGSWK